mgnify:CR=1 FL=1
MQTAVAAPYAQAPEYFRDPDQANPALRPDKLHIGEKNGARAILCSPGCMDVRVDSAYDFVV